MRERDIFDAALAIADPAQRSAYLAAVCASDDRLRQHLEGLLAMHQQLGSFLEAPAPALGATIDERPLTEGPGTVIGPYKLLEQIGEGGMGLVFVAEQQQPLRRKVALKVIKPGMDSRQVVARFEAERQALALMDHPNIAHVFDGGATASGRPYFVMELVKGVPLTDFCDQSRLPVRERLGLFVSVCQAVQHAHQKGIIHRDLKPSNVLVTLHDTVPVVKVIDFGIAKATGQQLTDKTLNTGFAQMVGTPLYMSPEQAGLSGLDVDTRSDIYSLGVLLYELLTGTTPFDKERLKEAGYDELRRIIREEEPPRPSTRVSTLGQAAGTVSTQRKSDPKRLSQVFRGELDWIVMRALEKDRNRRYDTASAFAADVQRYLYDEPVRACPPSAWYRFCKFARRNKRALVMASVVTLAILLAVGTLGWAVRDRVAREAGLARDREARQARVVGQVELILAEVERLEREQKWPEALAAAKRAEAMMAGTEADPSTQDRVLRVLANLELVQRLEQIRAEGSSVWDDSLRENAARADRKYAAAFREAGIDLDALPARSAADRIALPRAVAVALIAAVDDWAFVRGVLKDPAGARRLTQVARAADPDPWRQLVRDAARREDWAALKQLAGSAELERQPAGTLFLLAGGLYQRGHPEGLEVMRRAQGKYPGDFWINFRLGLWLIWMRPPYTEEGMGYMRAAVALRPKYAWPMTILGCGFEFLGRYDEATTCQRKAVELAPIHVNPHFNLGHALATQGKLDEAIAEYKEVIRLKPAYAEAHCNLGAALWEKGRADGAIAAHKEAIRLKPDYALDHNNLGVALGRKEKLDEAIACYREAIRLKPDYAEAYNNLGTALRDKGRLDEAIAAYTEAIRLKPDYAEAHTNLGNAFRDKGRLDEGIAAYKTAIRLKPELAEAHCNLGVAHWRQGRLDEAIAACKEAIRVKPTYAEAHCNLGIALADKGLLDAAIAAHKEAIRLKPELANAHCNLGYALTAKGCLDEAIAACKEAIRLKPDNALAHYNLGTALFEKGSLDEAIAAFKEALRLKPELAEAHSNLGVALVKKGRLDEAIAACKDAIRLKPDNALAWNNLANALQHKGLLDEAIAAYRDATRLKPDYALAHFNLGCALAQKGRFHEALASLRRGHELGSKDPRWACPSGAMLQACEQLIELEGKLAAVLKGDTQPSNAAERVAFAQLCQTYKKRHVSAARFYAEAFAADPKLADDLRTSARYNAACAAALAGCGQGEDAGKVDDKERARLRRQALGWLRADLDAWQQNLEKESDKVRPIVQKLMQHWQQDADFAGVRGAGALAKLSEAERRNWQQLWEDVAALHRRAVPVELLPPHKEVPSKK